MIKEYQRDPEETVKTYQMQPQTNGIYLKPLQEDNAASAYFYIETDGNYFCTYTEGGIMFPSFYKYSSHSGEWERTD